MKKKKSKRSKEKGEILRRKMKEKSGNNITIAKKE